MTLSAVILAGGPSRRMGCDKARIALRGQTLLETQVARVQTLAPSEVFISGRGDVDYGSFGCPVLRDAVPEGGPLAGIMAAMLMSSASHLLVLAVDLPFLCAGILERLVDACTESSGVVPRVGSRVEPFVAVYPTDAADLAERMFRRRLRSPRVFAENCLRRGFVRFVPVPETDWPCFADCHYPEDLPEGAFCTCVGTGGRAFPFSAPPKVRAPEGKSADPRRRRVSIP